MKYVALTPILLCTWTCREIRPPAGQVQPRSSVAALPKNEGRELYPGRRSPAR
jgi:hypothetical protein